MWWHKVNDFLYFYLYFLFKEMGAQARLQNTLFTITVSCKAEIQLDISAHQKMLFCPAPLGRMLPLWLPAPAGAIQPSDRLSTPFYVRTSEKIRLWLTSGSMVLFWNSQNQTLNVSGLIASQYAIPGPKGKDWLDSIKINNFSSPKDTIKEVKKKEQSRRYLQQVQPR